MIIEVNYMAGEQRKKILTSQINLLEGIFVLSLFDFVRRHICLELCTKQWNSTKPIK